MKADIVVYDRNKQITLITEVKNKPNVSWQWAAQWRRNILAHEELPDVTFFMIALPNKFYLWKDAGNKAKVIEPSFEINAEPILKTYLQKDRKILTENGLESVISSWLNSLLNIENNDLSIQDWGIRSGFFNAIKGGTLVNEVFL